MNETFELVSRAVGNPDISPATARRLESSAYFDLFDVQLPLPDFCGVPREWRFVVLNGERFRKAVGTPDAVLEEAHSIISGESRCRFVVLISDEPTIHLVDEFGTFPGDVFCLDHAELPHAREYKKEPRLAPFILAIRRRLSVTPLLAAAFSPYQRNIPVSDWRFFGREKQLKEIISGRENLVLVGARRVGKTSLLLEAERRLREEGVNVYYVDVQDCRTANEVVRELLRVVDPREAVRALKHHEVLHDSVLANLLRRLSTGSKKTVLLLDELGNVLTALPKEDWKFMGVLRKYGSHGQMKYVISCFQEVYFKQQDEFSGPLINFASTLRLDVLSKQEVEEFVIAPLEFWRPLGTARPQLLDLVVSNVGSHPYFLQFFCHALFDRFTGDRNFSPIHQANLLLKKDVSQWFQTAVDEIFFRIPSPTLQYLFLRRCHEAESAGLTLSHVELDDDWLEKTLTDLGYRSTVRSRRNLLDGMEMHGLCAPISYDRAKKIITAPLIYQYIQRSNSSFENWLRKLGGEIDRERSAWELERLSA